MKRLVLLALLACFCTSTFAERNLVRSEDVKAFLKSTTYVVLEDNPMSGYNFKIKEAIEKSWTITPFKFISSKEFETLRQDIDKSFLVLVQMKFEKDKIPAVYNFMSLSMGAAVKKITDMPDVCSLPLSYFSVPEDEYIYKIESLLRFMQNHIKLIDQNPTLIKNNIFEYYNKNTKEIKGKELWVVENDIEKNTRALAQIRKNYSYTVKVVKTDAIEKAIAEKNPNVVYLHKVGPSGTRLQARCYKIVIGAGDDQIYYFDYHTITKSEGDGLLESDFKKMGRK
jgi:phosphopantetheinyl transferase (holo-ACP synthase)